MPDYTVMNLIGSFLGHNRAGYRALEHSIFIDTKKESIIRMSLDSRLQGPENTVLCGIL